MDLGRKRVGGPWAEVKEVGGANLTELLYTLWSDHPAADGMTEAFLLGNGRVGGMVFSGCPTERICFNENTLWGGDPAPVDRPEAAAVSGLTRTGKRVACTIFGSTPRQEETAGFCSAPDFHPLRRWKRRGTGYLFGGRWREPCFSGSGGRRTSRGLSPARVTPTRAKIPKTAF